jgi:diguanylate cyclase (GGDEF)-like protein/PAS domain S-box-containing protein
MARPPARLLPVAAALLAGLAAVQLGWVGAGLPGNVVVSDLTFVASSLFTLVACGAAARRLKGRARFCWAALTGTGLCWTVANGMWAWYEVVLHRAVPTPSPTDWFYSGALVFALLAVVAGLLPLVQSRAGAVRVLLDVLVTGGALLFLAWNLALGPILESRDGEVLEAVTWIYPVVGITASTVAFATMTRVSARARLPWLLLGAGLLVGSAVDAMWAYASVTDGFAGGGVIDPLWTLAYGIVGLSALAARREAGLTSSRLAPARWESLGAYVPVSLAVATAIVEHVRGRFDAGEVGAGLALVCVIVLRQVLAILENHELARSLEERVAERTSALQASEERFRSIVSNISDTLLLIDAELVVRYQSPAAGRALGFADGELLGRTIDELANHEDLEAARQASAAVAGTAGRVEVYVARVRHRDGSWRHMEVTVTDLLDHPAVGHIVLALRDVGERVELEDRLRHQAYHDALTGLANRTSLHEELGGLLAGGRRPSMLLVDLDEFKAVNDTAGHDLGDQVLVAVAERLVESTRPGDVVARLGGDEFAVVLHDDPRALAGVAVAERILQALRLPLEVRGRQVRCLGSIGVAAAGDGATAAGLLRDADVAMYVAKARGKGRCELFTAAMREAVVRRQGIEELLRRSVVQGRLVLHYQPVVELETGRVTGMEALLRLRGDDGGLVSPHEFVPVAEESGLIVEVGSWVLHESCRSAAGWQELRPDGPPVEVNVNVSTVQLRDPALPRTVAAALEAAGLEPGLLTLEITEGALGPDDADVEETLRALRGLGVRLSIDDFGAGYSSLGRLRDLQVDQLKIDRSFVGELVEGGEAPVIDAILAMAAGLGLSVVAEGIETPEQAALLRATSCDRGQGFLFARPLPAHEVPAMLTRPPLVLHDQRS